MAIDEAIPNVAVPEGSSGEWRVKRITITDEQAKHDAFMAAIRGSSRHVRAGPITQLWRGGQLVMSDTPDEKRDHYWFVSEARGSVLINGLGLGMVLGAVLLKPEVTAVTVVELSGDVIKLVAPSYPDPRVTIIQADALEWSPAAGTRYDAVWHDIWDDICTDNLEDMKRLHRRYGRRTHWQGSWGREICERHAA